MNEINISNLNRIKSVKEFRVNGQKQYGATSNTWISNDGKFYKEIKFIIKNRAYSNYQAELLVPELFRIFDIISPRCVLVFSEVEKIVLLESDLVYPVVYNVNFEQVNKEYLLKIFLTDFIIGNLDRNPTNFIFSELNGTISEPIPIDHSLCFFEHNNFLVNNIHDLSRQNTLYTALDFKLLKRLVTSYITEFVEKLDIKTFFLLFDKWPYVKFSYSDWEINYKLMKHRIELIKNELL